MGYQAVIVEKANSIATITLNRPEKLNAWNGQMQKDLHDALIEVDYDDDTRVEFYIGDYEDGDNDIFKWYDCEYFYEDSDPRNRCPLVVIDHPYDDTLTGYFGDKWEEPFKKWFTENFDLPVKTVEWKRMMG